MALPSSWAELYARLGRLLAADDAEIDEWLRQAVRGSYGAVSLRDLDRRTRAVVFQKASGVLLALEDGPEFEGPIDDLAFALDLRAVVAATFARYFGGIAVEGPPWRICQADNGRPTRAEYLASAGFN